MPETHSSFAACDRIFLGLSLICSVVIALTYDFNSSYFYLFASALILLVVWAKPVWSLSAFIFLLPVFGNKPATQQFHLLLLIGANLNAALAIKSLLSDRGTSESSPVHKATFRHPIMLLVLMYLLVSAGSLTSLPWKQLLLDFQACGGINLKLLPYQLKAFLNSDELNLAYPILTVLLTFQAASVAFFVHRYVLRDSRNAAYFCFSFGAGLVLALSAGLMDFYRIINLEVLRPLDPYINPGGLHLRLQSFFGHSGWLAEYIVLASPFVLILFLLKTGQRTRLSLIIGLLWLAGYVTVLTYQRGGWVAYPLTALLVWVSANLLRIDEEENARPFWANIKRATLQSLVSLVLLLGLSLMAVYVVGRINLKGQGNGMQQYRERFMGITEVSDRTVFFRAGWRLGLLHPFLGGGSEGFHFLYEKEFLEPGGKYVNDPIALGNLYGTAHNVYMQTFSGKGFWGLIFLLLPIFYLLASGCRLLLKKALGYRSRLITLISICSCCGFLIYGNAQEFFYIQSLQYAFFIILAIFSSSLSSQLSLQPGWGNVLWTFLALGFVAHLVWEYAFPGESRKLWRTSPEFGCYSQVETDETGRQFNWCSQNFRQRFHVLLVDGQPSALLNLGVINPQPDAPLVNLRIKAGGEEIARQQVRPNADYSFSISIPPAFRGMIQNQAIVLEVISDNLFIPLKDIEGGKEARFLSTRMFVVPVSTLQDHGISP
jgi:hypothetical protein